MNEKVQYPNMTRADSTNEAPTTGPGTMLKHARERSRKTQEEIARELHFKIEVVQAIEENNFDALPSLIYVRGYLRSYARFIEFPEEKVLKSLDALGLKDKPVEAPKLIKENSEDKGASFRWMAYLFMLVSLVFLLLWWHHNRIANPDAEGLLTLTKKKLFTPPTARQQQQAEQTTSVVSVRSSSDDDNGQLPSVENKRASDSDLDNMLNNIDDIGHGG